MAITAKLSAQVRASVGTKKTVVKAKVKAKVKVVQRPPAEDPKREEWDRAARCIWRVLIVLITILISVLSRNWGFPEVVAVVAEKVPEMVREMVEFFAKL
jgi:hypothetical protein